MTTTDMVIELDDNKPGALAHVATLLSDAGVNIAAATHLGKGQKAELHILVPHPEAVRHALAVVHSVSITREREVVVVEAQDRPGELAELAGRVAAAGVNLDLVYVATGSRIVFGSDDLDGLRAALEGVAVP
ncbi:MAG: ACT domain-containing protein [Ilumatobacter sp.]|uniref:ACT domain-containing protein n=1 Tax=Ilumatobacter sp. TaxID=1967498 RepID=UPI00260416E1|nr:ACT domain-containing protein [Ilumatobacter sp.]MDJ0767960.1 ACT domain-containing protein [Ilumatobacter sp.]